MIDIPKTFLSKLLLQGMFFFSKSASMVAKWRVQYGFISLMICISATIVMNRGNNYYSIIIEHNL